MEKIVIYVRRNYQKRAEAAKKDREMCIRDRHYTKAAEKLNISQPTLSHSIAAMEKELGAFLFEKQGRNVVLTKYGRIYMFYVENALTQLEPVSYTHLDVYKRQVVCRKRL